MRIAEWLLLALGIAFFAARVLPRSWQSINTDFPNYYVSAHLVCEGYSTDRIYEWQWFARQKDRLRVDQPLAAFIPHTPFSALVMTPLCGLSPLHAKRVWTLCNLAMMAAVLVLLVSITGVPFRWLAIAALFSIPLYRNLEFGQLYILLLLLIALACYAYARGAAATAGALIAIATALKIFPGLLLFFFFRKRNVRALYAFLLTLAICSAICLIIFPPRMLLTYLTQVLPFALRGEANDPFGLSANSLNALLHHLFISQPRSNSYPLVHFPAAVALVEALLSGIILLAAVLTFRREDDRSQDILGFGILLLAVLATSTVPASYHFVLLLIPLAAWAAHFAHQARWRSLATLLFLYLLIGWPLWPAVSPYRWSAFLTVPRLWCVLALLGFLSWQLRSRWNSTPRLAMTAVFTVLCVIQATAGVAHLRSIYSPPTDSTKSSEDVFAVSSISADDSGVSLSAMTINGWRRANLHGDALQIAASAVDEVSQFSRDGVTFYEADSPTPEIHSTAADGSYPLITHGESPVLSPDGRQLAFLRTNHGRASLWLRDLLTHSETPITSSDFDVYDLAFAPNGDLLFSAVLHNQLALYRTGHGAVTPLGISNARFPAPSPNGRWLAYSQLSHGVWHLALRDLATLHDEQLSSADCNDLDPAWHPSSSILYYASDCGNGLWETSLHVRSIHP